MTKTNITENIDMLIGEDITQDVSDILVGEQKSKKNTIKIPENIKSTLDTEDLSVPEIKPELTEAEEEDLGRIFEDLDENKKDRQSFENKKIFDDAKKTEDENSEDSKKVTNKDTDFKETTTRKVDLRKALEEDEKKNNLQKADKSLEPKNFANGIRIPAKIRSAMDIEDEEDEKKIIIFNPNDLSNQLHNYITDQEKGMLQQKNINENNQLKNAEKLDAINKATKDLKDLGLKFDKKEANQSMVEATNTHENKEKIVKKVISKQLKIKTKDVKTKDLPKLTGGIKKIKDMGGNVEGMKAKDAMRAGEKDVKDKDVAKIIYENAKVKEQEKTAKTLAKSLPKDDVEKIVEKTGRAKDEKTKTKDAKEPVKEQENTKKQATDREKEEAIKKELDKENDDKKLKEQMEKQMVLDKQKEKEGR